MRHTLSMPNKRMEGTGTAVPSSVPASIKGWDAISSVADMPPDHAIALNNFIPRPGYLEPRRGSQSFASGIGTTTTPVNTIMGYRNPDTTKNKLFAAAGTHIYDITMGATASTTATAITLDKIQFCNFTNSSGTSYLICTNGVDTPQIYNGSVWASLSVTGLTIANIIQPQVWKGRLWFCQASSTQVGYMPIGAISGTAAIFDLGSLMSKGGYINAIATWSIDTKQSVDEYIAFISSEGQIFVYEGTDPSTAPTFALVGVYNLGSPIGRRCFLRISGNLWIITTDGVIPLTEMITQVDDQTVAPRVAITSMIMNAINGSVQLYQSNFGWQFISYPRGTLAVLNIPQITSETSVQYVMNTITGAWCQFIGLNANCWELYGDMLYFGSNDGRVYVWDVGSGDYVNGPLETGISATVQTSFNYFNSRGVIKRFTAIRPIINSDQSVTVGVGLNIDYGIGAPISAPAGAANTGAQWDISQWDDALWPVNFGVIANWTTVDGIGICASIISQVNTQANGNANGVIAQLNGWDLRLEPCAGFF
jgi:hypothetical protein